MKPDADDVFKELYTQLNIRKIDDTADLDSWEKEDDYETGVYERANAALELGKLKDEKAVSQLARSLDDPGDYCGRSSSGSEYFLRGANVIQSAAVEALVMIGGEKAVNVLEEKLRTLLGTPPYLHDGGVSKKTIIESLGKINHQKSREVMIKLYNEFYLTDKYRSEGSDVRLAVMTSLKKSGF